MYLTRLIGGYGLRWPALELGQLFNDGEAIQATCEHIARKHTKGDSGDFCFCYFHDGWM